MRVVVFSDTHGNLNNARRIMEKSSPRDCFIFLGDGEREIASLRALYPDREIHDVAGNCDRSGTAPGEDFLFVGNVKIAFFHGHNHLARLGIDRIVQFAKENCAQIVLFGHTHVRFYKYLPDDRLHILNPGSAALPRDEHPPSFAVIDVSDKGILCNIADI
ncbi:MAG: YfcE family phosphodiesterase [Oscillospiraceae bacterium]